MHDINYIFLLGERSNAVNPLLPSKDLQNKYLFLIGEFPQNLEHFAFGIGYYQHLVNTGLYGGYKIMFMYVDSVDSALSIYEKVYPKTLSIFFLCTDNDLFIKQFNNTFKTKNNNNFAYYCPKGSSFMNDNPNVLHNKNDYFDFLFVKIFDYFDPYQLYNFPFSVDLTAKEADLGLHFMPTLPNTFTMNTAFGNWNFHINTISEKKQIELQAQATKEYNTFNRQYLIVKQIRKITSLELSAQSISDTPLIERISAPLIVTLPFTNADARKKVGEIYKENKDFKTICKIINEVLSQGSTHNYTFGIKKDYFEHFYEKAFVTNDLFYPRSAFLDTLGMLHSSYRFSPYLRLPFLGKDINTSLSFVSSKISEHLISAKKKSSINFVIQKIGKEISDRTISDELKKHLKSYPQQIFGITDLPLEWIDIDGVPLGFSHDVCRVPETPLDSGLLYYVVNEVKYFVPKDIINKTLVVFGTEESSFALYQKEAKSLSKELGFLTRTCESVDALEKTIKEIKPEFLIIDSHGNADVKNNQTYIKIGSEKLYPKDVVDRAITAPLVFLSACNTAPTYNAFNTIAGAMIQVGAFSVTSSYLPLQVADASILYLRILRQLSQAAINPFHRNWLSFISHILRTSYIYDAYNKYMINKGEKLQIEELSQVLGLDFALSMNFHNRRTLYFQLKNGKLKEGIKVNLHNVIPHYLMYTTIGRADLVNFECYMEHIIKLR